MKAPRRPPRVVLSILERCVPDSGPLAGDLAEEFALGRGRPWIWWQVLGAIAGAWLRAPDEIRPLRLVDLQPIDAQLRSRRLLFRFEPVNLTASPIHGVGGLGLLVLSLLVSVVTPVVWWVLLVSFALGAALGAVIISLRR